MPTGPRTQPLELGVLVSGRGTNLQAIIDAIAQGELRAEVALVICNHPEAEAIDRAKKVGIAVELCKREDFPSRLAHQRAIAGKFAKAKVDLVVCAGWDRVLSPEVVQEFAGRIINIHPSLLPSFGGRLHAIEDALNYGVKITGCTVHFVTDEVDSGPIISQAAVLITAEETPETLAKKIHEQEHRLLVEAIKLYSEGRLYIDGQLVKRTTIA
ncbi:MAG: phosphoribosylglycinamide formyltransferase [Chloroflexi bacterium]|nr:phosphoribosylglycinamide formyltransferase [Chloroflexota bacterium]